jgi:hypothetical protein
MCGAIAQVQPRQTATTTNNNLGGGGNRGSFSKTSWQAMTLVQLVFSATKTAKEIPTFNTGWYRPPYTPPKLVANVIIVLQKLLPDDFLNIIERHGAYTSLFSNSLSLTMTFNCSTSSTFRLNTTN